MKPSLKPGLFNRRNLRKAKPETIVQTTAKTFTYRQSVLYSPVLFTGQFYKQISPEDYSKKHLSYTAQLPLKITSLSILQDNKLVILDENNIGYNVYPPIEFEELFNTENFSFKWILEGTELPVNDVSLKLPVDNYFQNDNLLLDIVDSENNTISSNSVTINEITSENWTPHFLEKLNLWLDASDTSSIIKDSNNKVSNWADKSGQGNDFSETNSSYLPTYSTDHIDFTSSSTRLTSFLDVNYFNDFEIFCVIHTKGGTGNYGLQIFTVTNGGEQNNFAFKGASDGSWLYYYDSNLSSNLNLLDGDYIHDQKSLKYLRADDNGDMLLGNDFIDATLSGYTPLSNRNTNPQFSIGESYNEWGNFLLYELILTPYLSLENREKVEGYLSHKWGLVAQLPSNHPYKNSPPQSISDEIATFTSVEIEQDLSKVQINLTNSNGTYTPSDLTPKQMVNKNLIHCNWFVDGVKQSEKSASFILPSNNSLQNSDIYLRLIDSHYQTINSNTITIQEILQYPSTKSLAFNGTNSYVDFNPSGDLDDFTISLYAKANSAGQYDSFFGLKNYQDGILFRPQYGEIQLYINGSSWFPNYTRDNNWHHYVLIREAGNLQIIIDKQELFSTTYNSTINITGTSKLGNSQHSTNQGWDGNISNFIIYKRALSDSEIDNLYSFTPIDHTNRYLQWNLEEGSGTTVNDESTNNIQGTINNGTWENIAP